MADARMERLAARAALLPGDIIDHPMRALERVERMASPSALVCPLPTQTEETERRAMSRLTRAARLRYARAQLHRQEEE